MTSVASNTRRETQMRSVLGFFLLGLLVPDYAMASCDNMPIGVAPTDPEKTFVRDVYGIWGAPRKNGSKHKGVDLLVRQSYQDKQSYSVHAIASGVVAYARLNGGVAAGFGNVVVIDHENGCYSFYAHLAHQPLSTSDGLTKLDVKVGDQVSAGQVIGYMVRPDSVPSTGNARNIDIANQHQVHFSFIEADSGRRGNGALKDSILAPDARFFDPSAFIGLRGIPTQKSVAD